MDPALVHHVVYGAPPDRYGTPDRTRTITKDDRQVFIWPKPPLTAQWNQKVAAATIPNLLRGFQGTSMDDNWFVYTESIAPPATASASRVSATKQEYLVRFFRSWTGFHMFDVTLQLPTGDPNAPVDSDDGRFTHIAWVNDHDTHNGDLTEQEAKEQAMMVCQWCMDVEFVSQRNAVANGSEAEQEDGTIERLD